MYQPSTFQELDEDPTLFSNVILLSLWLLTPNLSTLLHRPTRLIPWPDHPGVIILLCLPILQRLQIHALQRSLVR